MSERGRAIVIFGVIGAIAAAAIFYFFEIYRPHQITRDAQAEVVAWEARWTSARGCLLGAQPGSPATSEALAIHELAPDPWDRGACTGLMSKITRGDQPDTGIVAVEAAWRELDHAATKAAAAFAEHVTRGPANDPLPAALDALDVAHAKLRSTAGMPIETEHVAPLPRAQAIALADHGDPVIQLDIHGPGSSHGIVVFGMTRAKQGVQVVLPAGGAPSISRVVDGAMRGVPDASWGAALADGAIDVGAADNDGNIAQPLGTSIPKATAIAAVVGTPAHGLVIYGGTGDKGSVLGAAHVGSAAIEVTQPEPTGDGFTVVDPTGRGLAVASTGATVTLVPFSPDGIERAFGVEGAVDVACLADRDAWAQGDAGLVELGSAGPVMHSDAAGANELLACLADGALLRRHHDLDVVDAPQNHTLVCTQHCREVAWPHGAPSYAALTAIGGKLVAVAIHGNVLGVWHEAGGAPTFYGLPTTLTLVAPTRAVASDGKAIDALARDPANNYFVVRVPAS